MGILQNSIMAIAIRVILEAMNHPQPPTTIKTYNATVQALFIKISIKINKKYWYVQ